MAMKTNKTTTSHQEREREGKKSPEKGIVMEIPFYKKVLNEVSIQISLSLSPFKLDCWQEA